MLFNESREYKSPVLVDEAFLRAIRNALELAKPIVSKGIADSSGLNIPVYPLDACIEFCH